MTRHLEPPGPFPRSSGVTLGDSTPEPQTGAPTYANKLSAVDTRIDWTRPALELVNQIRALTERMPVSCDRDGLRIRILRALVAPLPSDSIADDLVPGQIAWANKKGIAVLCGDGNAVKILELQLNRGKGRPMNAAAALNGYPELFKAGLHFGDGQSA